MAERTKLPEGNKQIQLLHKQACLGLQSLAEERGPPWHSEGLPFSHLPTILSHCFQSQHVWSKAQNTLPQAGDAERAGGAARAL